MLYPDLGDGYYRGASPGRLAAGDPRMANISTRLDSTGEVTQKTTITASGGTAAASYTYRFRDSGLDESITAIPAASSAASLVAAFYAAVLLNPALMARLQEVDTTATTVVLDAISGTTLTVTEVLDAGGHLSFAQVAASAAPQYIWGRAIEVTSVASPTGMRNEGIVHPTIINGAVVDLTETFAAADNFTLSLGVMGPGIDGVLEEVHTWVGDTDTDTTDLAAKAAIDASAYYTVTIVSTGVMTIDALPGVNLVVLNVSNDGAATVAAALDTAADIIPQFALVVDDQHTPTLDSYPQTTPTGPLIAGAVATLEKSGGRVTYAVLAPGASLAGTDVYVETTVGATLGRLYDTASTTRIPWADAQWDTIDADDPNIAYVRL